MKFTLIVAFALLSVLPAMAFDSPAYLKAHPGYAAAKANLSSLAFGSGGGCSERTKTVIILGVPTIVHFCA